MAIEGVDAFTLKTATRPQFVFDETIVDFINVKRYMAGKMTPSPITVTLYDPIVPSAAQKVMQWVRLVHESTTGRMGYAEQYKRDINLQMLGPAGEIVEDWLLQGVWIQDVNFNDLDYSVSDLVDITLVLRWDSAVLQF